MSTTQLNNYSLTLKNNQCIKKSHTANKGTFKTERVGVERGKLQLIFSFLLANEVSKLNYK